jgi:hypothetical protein
MGLGGWRPILQAHTCLTDRWGLTWVAMSWAFGGSRPVGTCHAVKPSSSQCINSAVKEGFAPPCCGSTLGRLLVGVGLPKMRMFQQRAWGEDGAEVVWVMVRASTSLNIAAEWWQSLQLNGSRTMRIACPCRWQKWRCSGPFTHLIGWCQQQ